MKTAVLSICLLMSFATNAKASTSVIDSPKFEKKYYFNVGSNPDGICKHLGFSGSIDVLKSPHGKLVLHKDFVWRSASQKDLIRFGEWEILKYTSTAKTSETVLVDSSGNMMEMQLKPKRYISKIVCE